MNKAKEYFESHEFPHKLNELVCGQKVTKKKCIELMTVYAQQVSRDVAVEFELRHHPNKKSKTAKKFAYICFDKWIKTLKQ